MVDTNGPGVLGQPRIKATGYCSNGENYILATVQQAELIREYRRSEHSICRFDTRRVRAVA